MFTLHILSDTSEGSQGLKFILLMYEYVEALDGWRAWVVTLFIRK